MSTEQIVAAVIATLGALGIGGLVGSVIQSRAMSQSQDKQRAHDLAVRRLDQQHELDLRRLDDQQRMRDQRLARLREGFLSLVQALLKLEEVLDAMERPTRGTPADDTPSWKALLAEANLKADQARADLLLEKLGEPAIKRYVMLTRHLRVHLAEVDDVLLLQKASSPGLPDAVKTMRDHSATITKSIVDQIRQAQEALETLEAPISLDVTSQGDVKTGRTS